MAPKPKPVPKQLDITDLNSWLAETLANLMSGGSPPVDIKELHAKIRGNLPESLQSQKDKVSKKILFEILYKYFFGVEKRGQLVEAALKAKKSAEEFSADLVQYAKDRVPPKWVIEKMFEELHGRTRAPRWKSEMAAKGMLRIPFTDAKDRELPATTFRKPHHALPDSNEDKFNVAVISALKVGLPYNVNIWENLSRCGFSAARKLGCNAMILGGGLLEIALKKATGPDRLLSDLLSGIQMDPESFAEHYQEKVRQIIESGEMGPIFATAAERFAELLRGLYKLTKRPSGQPEFTGPIYAILSYEDLEIVRRMAYFELLYKKVLEFNEAQAQVSYCSKMLAFAQEDGSDEEIEKAEENLSQAADMVARALVTNFEPIQDTKVYKKALSYLISEIEKHIAGNVKVIAQNEAFVRFGKSKHVFRFVCSQKPNAFKAEVSAYGPSQRSGSLANMTVLMHPRASYFRQTTRQNYLDGRMFGEAAFVEAPMLVDAEPILDRLEKIHSRHPVARTVSDSMYNGGMLILSTDPALSMPRAKLIPSESVRNIGKVREMRPQSKMVWLFESTDPHIDAAMRHRIVHPSGATMGVTEATLELMSRLNGRKSGAPYPAMYIVADDILHGNHFGTERRPHYNEITIARVLQTVRKRQEEAKKIRNKERLLAYDSDTIKLLASQLAIRVPHMMTTQMFELVDGVVEPYKDVFKEILLKAKQVKLNVRGISEITGVPDRRDLGIINLGSGNHPSKTTDYMFHDAPVVAEFLRQALQNDPDLKGLDMRKLICAPISQSISFGYGTLSVDGKFTYGLHISATPPKRTSWYDLVEGWVKVNRQRGNPSSILNNMPIVHITGDKHFFAVCYAGDDLYVMGPAATHTDEYAEMAGGLPENNVGVAFIGLPIEGPDRGQIEAVHLTPTELQEGILHPEREFPWGDILTNSV